MKRLFATSDVVIEQGHHFIRVKQRGLSLLVLGLACVLLSAGALFFLGTVNHAESLGDRERGMLAFMQWAAALILISGTLLLLVWGLKRLTGSTLFDLSRRDLVQGGTRIPFNRIRDIRIIRTDFMGTELLKLAAEVDDANVPLSPALAATHVDKLTQTCGQLRAAVFADASTPPPVPSFRKGLPPSSRDEPGASFFSGSHSCSGFFGLPWDIP